MGIVTAMVLERLDAHICRVLVAQAMCELDLAMHGIIMPDEAAEKADYDGLGSRRDVRRDGR